MQSQCPDHVRALKLFSPDHVWGIQILLNKTCKYWIKNVVLFCFLTTTGDARAGTDTLCGEWAKVQPRPYISCWCDSWNKTPFPWNGPPDMGAFPELENPRYYISFMYTGPGIEDSHLLLYHINSYSASHDNWCTATLWNRIMTAQCEGMGEVGSARYEPATTSPMPEHKGFMLQ